MTNKLWMIWPAGLYSGHLLLCILLWPFRTSSSFLPQIFTQSPPTVPKPWGWHRLSSSQEVSCSKFTQRHDNIHCAQILLGFIQKTSPHSSPVPTIPDIHTKTSTPQKVLPDSCSHLGALHFSSAAFSQFVSTHRLPWWLSINQTYDRLSSSSESDFLLMLSLEPSVELEQTSRSQNN